LVSTSRAAEWTENWVELANGVPRMIGRSENCVGGYLSVPAGRGFLRVTVQDVRYIDVYWLTETSGNYAILGRAGAAASGHYSPAYPLIGHLEPDPGVVASSMGLPLEVRDPAEGRWFVAAFSDRNTEKVTAYTLTATHFPKAPDITVHPANRTVCAGDSVTFTVTATGESLEYQWYKGGTAVSGARSSTYTMSQAQLTDAGDYRVKVTNPGGSDSSRWATLTVLARPGVRVEPANQTIVAGQTATLTAVVSEPMHLTYQWYLGQSGDMSRPVFEATSAVYTTPPLEADAACWVRVSNGTCAADSQTATVTVESAIPPQITQHPRNQTVSAGQTATLSVTATGTEPLSYQWYAGQRGDTTALVTNATAASYTTPPLTSAASYWVRVSNAADSADSQTATVTIATETLVPPPGMTVAYDAAREHLVLFGGRFGGVFTNQTWLWLRDRYVKLSPATNPPVRLAPGMVFDPARQQVILFGGQKYPAGPHWNGTWAWTGTDWVELRPVSSPPARRGQGMMFDSARQQVVLFGGGGDGGLLSDTWLWDGQNWRAASPAQEPPASIYHGLCFQTHVGKGVLAGLGHSSVPAALRTSTWSWDGTNWTLEQPSQKPAVALHPSHGLRRDAATDRALRRPSQRRSFLRRHLVVGWSQLDAGSPRAPSFSTAWRLDGLRPGDSTHGARRRFRRSDDVHRHVALGRDELERVGSWDGASPA
jgi:hypothetical protein